MIQARNLDLATLRRGTAQSATATYTATTPGFYTFRANINTNKYGSSVTATVNSTIVWRCQWNSYIANYNVQFDEEILLLAGDTITVAVANDASVSNLNFRPLIAQTS